MGEILSNQVVLRGQVITEPAVSHKVYGEVFMEMEIGVRRISGYEDRIPVTISGRLFGKEMPVLGDFLWIQGQVRTYNRYIQGKNRLIITIFAQNVKKEEASDEFRHENRVSLEGYLCREPYYRISPLGREIADLMVAVNRMYGKSDYVPCIAWGRNAKYAKTLDVGQKIRLAGRIQSREYRKKGENGTFLPGIAREVSIYKIEEEEE